MRWISPVIFPLVIQLNLDQTHLLPYDTTLSLTQHRVQQGVTRWSNRRKTSTQQSFSGSFGNFGHPFSFFGISIS